MNFTLVYSKEFKRTISEEMMKEIPDNETLIRGLEFLGGCGVSEASAKDFLAIVGEDDKFSDPFMLKCRMPQLDIVAGAGHEPEQLLKRLAQRLCAEFKI